MSGSILGLNIHTISGQILLDAWCLFFAVVCGIILLKAKDIFQAISAALGMIVGMLSLFLPWLKKKPKGPMILILIFTGLFFRATASFAQSDFQTRVGPCNSILEKFLSVPNQEWIDRACEIKIEEDREEEELESGLHSVIIVRRIDVLGYCTSLTHVGWEA